MRLALVALGLVACGQAPDAPPISAPPTPVDARLETRASAIKDGYNDATSTNVVGMVSLSGWGIGICSGSLIAPNVVLTARHCVAPVLGEAENGGVDCTKTYFGDPSPAVGLYITTDQEMGRHGNYTAALEIRVPEDTAFCGNDVALVILDSAIPSDIAMPLVPRVDLPVLDKLSGSIPDAYSAVGYGEADDGQGDSGRRRRRDGLTAFCWDTNCPWYSSVTGGEWGGEAGVCQGDSGGPAIDALNRVIGVASRGNGGCANPVYTGVHVWADLIKKTALDAAAIGGYTAPAWATGWPTDPGFSYTVGIACAAPEECASGVCYRGYCTRFCSAEAPCDDPFSCSIDQGFCTTRDAGAACIGDSDCGGSPCISGVCSRGCNGSVLRCPGGFQCAAVDGRTAPAFTNGFCVPAAVGVFCGSDADCPGGACAQGTCTRACSASFGCPIAWHCDGAVAQCSPISIGGACSNDDSCAGGSCVDGACTRGCSVSSPCPATHACDTQTGFCQRVPYGLECAGDGQCDLGVCISGRCTAGCSEAGQCISGYTCDSSQKACLLIPAGDLCGSDGDCAGGLCEQGRCTRSCSAAAPCGEGTFCEEQSGKCLIPKEDVAAATCTAGTHGETSSGWMALLLVLGLGVTRRRVAVNQPG